MLRNAMQAGTPLPGSKTSKKKAKKAFFFY
jgi:hypothetical protein